MLKPRKCRKALVIVSPRVKIAVGKKLIPVNGPWAANQFQLYTTTSMSFAMQGMHKVRPRRMVDQLGMVARKLGTTYKRYMERTFNPSPALKMIKEMDFTRTVPTEAGGEVPMKRFAWANAGAMHSDAFMGIMKACGTNVVMSPEYAHANHVPETEKKHYFATMEPKPQLVVTGCGLHNGVKMQQRMAGSKDILDPTKDGIKGVSLTETQMHVLMSEFATEAERNLVLQFKSRQMQEEMDDVIEAILGRVGQRNRDRLAELPLIIPDTENPKIRFTGLMSIHKAKEGELLPPNLEIKGVHLKQSTLSTDEVTRLIEGFGDPEEKELLARLSVPGAVITPEDEVALQRAARQCLFREIEHMG